MHRNHASRFVEHAFSPIVLLLFCCASIIAESKEERRLTLDDAVATALRNNSLDIPLLEANRSVALCDHEASKSAYLGLSANVGIYAETTGALGTSFSGASLPGDSVSQGSAVCRQVSPYADPELAGQLPLPTGGTLKSSLGSPLSVAFKPETAAADIPLCATMSLHQPLSLPVIKTSRLLLDQERDQPRKIASICKMAREEFIVQVAQAYYEYAALQARLERARGITEAARSDVDVAKTKYTGGAISRSAVAAVQAGLEAAELDAMDLSVELTNKRADLAELLGQPIDTALMFCGTAEDRFALPDRDTLIAAASSRSEELKAMLTEAELTRLRSVWPTLFAPSLDLIYSFNPRWSDAGLRSMSGSWYARMELSMPLLPSREKRIERTKALAEYRRSCLLIEKERTRIRRNAADLHQSVIDSRLRIVAAQKSVDAAQNAYDLARDQFSGGSISRAELDSYVAKLEASQREIEEARAAVIMAHLRILQQRGLLLRFFGFDKGEV